MENPREQQLAQLESLQDQEGKGIRWQEVVLI